MGGLDRQVSGTQAASLRPPHARNPSTHTLPALNGPPTEAVPTSLRPHALHVAHTLARRFAHTAPSPSPLSVWSAVKGTIVVCCNGLFGAQVIDLSWTPGGYALLAASYDGGCEAVAWLEGCEAVAWGEGCWTCLPCHSRAGPCHTVETAAAVCLPRPIQSPRTPHGHCTSARFGAAPTHAARALQARLPSSTFPPRSWGRWAPPTRWKLL
jgi:hypothetical protein